ncbi:MAG: pirin family protein [Acidimicrobiia bacterium]
MSTEDSNPRGTENVDTRRRVLRTSRAVATSDGAGVSLARVFPTFGSMKETDPFLLMDELGPSTFGPREAPGFPDHPHRGFETVTYVLEGMFEHRDSTGGGGIIGPGETQWMTAGSGLVHSEMPAGQFFEEGGTSHGFQLWVNLPAAKKMIPPRYQDLKGPQLGTVDLDDGAVSVRVIAGSLAGGSGPGSTQTPIIYAHATLQSGACLDVPWPESFNALVYVFGGEIQVVSGPTEVAIAGSATSLAHGAQTLVELVGGDRVTLQAVGNEPAEVMLMGGEPIGEPIEHWGPFVMNTREEIVQAVRDYESGKLGVIVARDR